MNNMEVLELQQCIIHLFYDYNYYENQDFIDSIKDNWEIGETFIMQTNSPQRDVELLDNSFVGQLSRIKVRPGENVIAYEIDSRDIDTYSMNMDSILGRDSNHFVMPSVNTGRAYLFTSASNECVLDVIEKSKGVINYNRVSLKSSTVIDIKNVNRKIRDRLSERRAKAILGEADKKIKDVHINRRKY